MQIWDNYANRPKFLFTSFIEAHEGSGAHIGAVDEDLAHFLDRLYHTPVSEVRFIAREFFFPIRVSIPFIALIATQRTRLSSLHVYG